MPRGRFAVIGEDEVGGCVPTQESYLVRPTRRGRAVVARWAHNPEVAGSNPAPRYKSPGTLSAFEERYTALDGIGRKASPFWEAIKDVRVSA